jgi:hypothetical protein
MASAAMTQSLCCEYLTRMLALAAECSVNGQARERGRKSGDLRAAQLMRRAFWRMKPAQ